MRGNIESVEMEHGDSEPSKVEKEQEKRNSAMPRPEVRVFPQLGLAWTSKPQKHKTMNMCCVKLLYLW